MRRLARWNVLMPAGPVRLAAVLALCTLGGMACSGSASKPTPVLPLGEVDLAAQAQHKTPDDFAAHGWECRPSPVPGRRVCSHPHQGFPAVPPPDDRPPSFTLLVWENGSFAGTLILKRPDLYHGQPCNGSGEPYIFRPVIGYYECLHAVGR